VFCRKLETKKNAKREDRQHEGEEGVSAERTIQDVEDSVRGSIRQESQKGMEGITQHIENGEGTRRTGSVRRYGGVHNLGNLWLENDLIFKEERREQALGIENRDKRRQSPNLKT